MEHAKKIILLLRENINKFEQMQKHTTDKNNPTLSVLTSSNKIKWF